MSNHTPGPWTVGQAYKHGYSSGFIPIIGGNASVALVDAGDRHLPWASNAHLIAAAPDMLATLKRTLKLLLDSAEARGYNPPADAEAIAELEGAIAKAEGR